METEEATPPTAASVAAPVTSSPHIHSCQPRRRRATWRAHTPLVYARFQVRQLGEARQQRGRLLPSSLFGGRSRGGDVGEGRAIAQAQLQQLEVRPT